jgi:membrane-associated phospholipid phosphatase
VRPIVCLCAVLSTGLAQADDPTPWRNASDLSAAVLTLTGLTAPLLEDGHAGWSRSVRTFDGLAIDATLTEGLKFLTKEKRPYDDHRDSFPSLHASVSFEIAAAESYFHPSQAPLWYGAAALISYSRIPAHEHHWQDILAGAALGYASGHLAASSREGWPLNGGPTRKSRGLSFAYSFSF